MTHFSRAKNATTGSKLLNGVAVGAIIIGLSFGTVAHAEDSDQSSVLITGTSAATATAVVPVEETSRYYLRLMSQIFDGSSDFSHTQVAGFARMRKDNQSWTLMDFGDGAVVISDADGVAASGFRNVSGTELGVLYNYDSKRISGTSDLAKFHNDFVRPQLDKAPALGTDASWTASVPATAFGIAALVGGDTAIQISRSYFTFDGKPMVLVQYQVPVTSFDLASGTKITHWGRGFALSDPGFGTIYANVALHRSAASERDGSIRPYRFYRAAFASDDQGKAMLDIAKIPQLAAIYNEYFSKEALEVVPYSDQALDVDQSPVKLAANLDTMAMSIGENGANDNGTVSAAQTGWNRGNERPKSNVSLGAFGGGTITFGQLTEKATSLPASGGLTAADFNRIAAAASASGIDITKPRSPAEWRALMGDNPSLFGRPVQPNGVNQVGAGLGSFAAAFDKLLPPVTTGDTTSRPNASPQNSEPSLPLRTKYTVVSASNSIFTDAQLAERRAQAQADLDAYQTRRRNERDADTTRVARPRRGAFQTSAVTMSTFAIKPINFASVIFDEDSDLFDKDGNLKKVGPDDFVAPTFTPATFNAPRASALQFTKFDDDDYPGSGEVPSFTYESMSGKVATDLGPWEEWLATQNVRELERLARQAGYPNLAAALTDAANIIRLSQDTGYRRWANTAPNCGGLSFCGSNFLGLWAIKASTVALGDILNQSRDVFSTGGLSDISISGDILAYMLRDFGLEDGDIVDVLIQQFGRTVYSGRVNLTNAGEAFRFALRRGVAQLTLTAVNEGFASPNTAEIKVEQVTVGDGVQAYSLKTGESATLRIETNRPAGGN
jgi:hypothetical protein